MPSFPEPAEIQIRLQPVPANELGGWWEAIQAPLGKLLKGRGEYRLVDILEALGDHTMQLWVGGLDSFVITQVGGYPTKKVLTVLYAGGDLETIASRMGDLEAWARERRCDEIRIQGREGWERVFNMERLGVVLRREL